ncbi:methionine aminopeptidase 1D, mitochondrial isoform X3 [Diabrotica undecimpunctata]|uniref:methionine aminopeptidase 1D, mitochondrial isoform X3 n=1 Tax=Diabrotica undecimpunctata TaxID=50387 RepID=UPI003B63D325
MNSSKLSSIFTYRNLFWKRKKSYFGKYNVVTPGNVSPMLTVPEEIEKPSYSISGKPGPSPDFAEIKNVQQMYKMIDSCKLAADILSKVEQIIKVGIKSDEIDIFVFDTCLANNAYPSPLNYNHFPKSVCTSINNVACHGIPDDRPLEDGDIINVDITVYYNGYHGDCSKTFLVGNVDDEGKQLVEATELCLNEAISICKPENNYPGRMESGMTFTIEPILTQGDQYIVILDDKWTAITEDNARTAQFEHTVAITDTGVEILTK